MLCKNNGRPTCVCVFFSLPVDVLLKAVGDTPIMKTKKWAVERGRTIQSLALFISRFLKLEPNEQLVPFILSHTKFIQWYCVSSWLLYYAIQWNWQKLVKFAVMSYMPLFCHFFVQLIYVNQSFAPSPDQEVGVLFDVSVTIWAWLMLVLLWIINLESSDGHVWMSSVNYLCNKYNDHML